MCEFPHRKTCRRSPPRSRFLSLPPPPPPLLPRVGGSPWRDDEVAAAAYWIPPVLLPRTCFHHKNAIQCKYICFYNLLDSVLELLPDFEEAGLRVLLQLGQQVLRANNIIFLKPAARFPTKKFFILNLVELCNLLPGFLHLPLLPRVAEAAEDAGDDLEKTTLYIIILQRITVYQKSCFF